MIVYMRSNENKGAYGKLETPIKMIIEHESDLLSKKGGVRDWLFNVEKSNKFGETIINNNEFDDFGAVPEGGRGDNDMVEETTRKFIEHIQFMKEFSITKTMLEDSNYGIAADAKLRAENFVRAYYKTQHKLATAALINGTASSFGVGAEKVDTTTADGNPLFSSGHIYGANTSGKAYGTQSNFYWGDVADTTIEFESALGALGNKLRNMKDETGEPLGYTADTIILPGNRSKLEAIAKKVCGSELITGSGNNDINIQYGNWHIIVLPTWQTTDDRFMVMSSEANKTLRGNMFFNRVPLEVNNWVDNHTWNNCWSGRCRFGVGFGTYKHIMLCVDHASTAPTGATTTKIQ